MNSHSRASIQLLPLVIAAVLLFTGSTVHAATLGFASESLTLGTGSIVDIPVYLSAETSVNAVSAGVLIPAGFEFVSVADGNSITNLWVDQPAYNPHTRTLSFSGIIPGGFKGSLGKLVTIRLRAPSQLAGVLSFAEGSAVYLNGPDGKEDSLTTSPMNIAVKNSVPPIRASVADDVAPEAFTPVVSRDARAFDNAYFISFATQDKGSGIDHYEIQERASDTPLEGAWKTVQSPLVLSDQSRGSYVFVRAIDHAGNVRTEMVRPAQKSGGFLLIPGLLFLLALIALAITVYNKRYRHEHTREE